MLPYSRKRTDVADSAADYELTNIIQNLNKSNNINIYANALDFGADKLNVADSATSFNDLQTFLSISPGGAIFLPAGTYLFGSTFTVTQSIYGIWNLSKINGTLTLQSNVLLRDLIFSTTTGQIQMAANQNNVVLENIFISSSGAFSAVDYEGSNLINLDIKGSTITGGTSGILVNNNSGGKNFRLVNSNITGSTSDAVGINEPGVVFKNFMLIGNYLTCNASIGANGSGFSNAAAVNGVILGNIVTDAGAEGLHFEDAFKNNLAVGNVINSRRHGIAVYYYVTGGVQGDLPIVIGFNQVTQDPASLNTYHGIFFQNGPDGTLAGNPVIGNHVKDFANGIYLGAIGATQKTAIHVVEGNSIENCTTAVFADGSATVGECRQFGTNYANNCTNLFTPGSGHFSFGKVVSGTAPTTIINSPAYSNFMPSSCDGWAYPPANFTTNGAGTSQLIWGLSPAGANQRFWGRCRVKTRNSGTTNWSYISATVLWDGAALTVTDQINRSNGVLSAPSFTVSGGNFNFNLTSSSAVSLNANYVEFDGEYWDS